MIRILWVLHKRPPDVLLVHEISMSRNSSHHHPARSLFNTPIWSDNMAADETNSVTHSALDEIKPPSGIVLPPREIRNILEKTAGYVARNGALFEDRIRDKESANPKFSFLNPADPYFAFYEWRLSEVKAGRGTDVAAGRAGEAPTPVPEKPKGPPKPPDFQFSPRMPRINQKDLDVIRLTALFVAKNGRQFQNQLAQREASNPQFQFLIPNHTFHNFFQHIIDQYTLLLRAGGLDGEGGKVQQEQINELNQTAKNKYRILQRARQRGEYAKFQESERQQKEEEEERKKDEFARIDWGDFVVVETIDFAESDEQVNLPPPTNLSELQYASLEDRNKASIGSNMRIEEAMPGEDFTPQGLPLAQLPPHVLPVHRGPVPQYPTGPPEMAPPDAYANGPQWQPLTPQQEEEERRIQERAAARDRVKQTQADAKGFTSNMKIRENYVPKAAQKAAHKQSQQTALCSICHQQIPLSEMDEHMRSTMDPKRCHRTKATYLLTFR